MNDSILYLNVLVLDSIYHVLTADERIICHRLKNGHNIQKTLAVKVYANLVKQHLLMMPDLRIGQDRLTYFVDNDDMIIVEKFPEMYPVTTQLVNAAKNTLK